MRALLFSSAVLLLPLAAVLVAASHGVCPPQATHVYGPGPLAGPRVQAVLGPTAVTVIDTNTADCDGNGVPGDWDGDLDAGGGGGFFGWGPWADEPVCQNDLHVHGPNVAVADMVFNVAYLVAENDQSGPVVVNGVCETDGLVSSIDPDDCIGPVRFAFTGPAGATCGPGGGDGGFWVFLLPTNGYAHGTITAF